MGGFLKRLAGFALVALLGFSVLLLVYGANQPHALRSNLKYKLGSYGFMHSRMQEVKTRHNLDVLFVGSSHAYRGFDTRPYTAAGLNVFNMGSSSQSPIQTRMLLQRYMDQLSPRLVVLEVAPEMMTFGGQESAVGVISNDKLDRHVWQMASDVDHLMVWNTLWYTGIRQGLGLDDDFAEPLTRGNETYIPGGYTEKALLFNSPKSYPTKAYTIEPLQKQALQDILDLCAQHGAEVLFVQTPLASGFRDSFTNNAEMDSLFATYTTYINYNGRLALSDSLDFYDDRHLNQNGVAKLNAALLPLVQEVLN